jgi:hypothetical protein
MQKGYLTELNKYDCKDGIYMGIERRKANVRTEMLQFIRENVLTVTDLTRSTKLTDILNSYADKVSEEVFIIQSSKNKHANAVLADLEYFEELLTYKEAVEQALEETMYQITIERMNDVADIPLSTVLEMNNLDLDRILSLVDEVEEEEA